MLILMTKAKLMFWAVYTSKCKRIPTGSYKPKGSNYPIRYLLWEKHGKQMSFRRSEDTESAVMTHWFASFQGLYWQERVAKTEAAYIRLLLELLPKP